jgi:hypothetical protein
MFFGLHNNMLSRRPVEDGRTTDDDATHGKSQHPYNILLSNIDAKDIRQAKSWPSSLVVAMHICRPRRSEYSYVSKPLGRIGQDQWGTNDDERIPRPIAGTPDGGEIQWTREYDVQTYDDLIQVTSKGEPPRWRRIPFRENEPRWWEPMQRTPPV